MEGFILQLGSMSVQAGIVICVVLVVRAVFVKLHVPKKYMGLLWCLPYILMVCPWKVSAPFSFWQVLEQEPVVKVQTAVENALSDLEAEPVGEPKVTDWQNFENSTNPVEGAAIGGVLSENDFSMSDGWYPGEIANEVSGEGILDTETMGSMGSGVENLTVWLLQVAVIVWLAGLAVILMYSTISYVKLRKRCFAVFVRLIIFTVGTILIAPSCWEFSSRGFMCLLL